MPARFIAFGCLLLSYSVQAQNRRENFELPEPDTTVSHSLYDKIVLLDSRTDTTSLGIVQQGAFNAQARVIPKVPLQIQLSGLVAALVDSSARAGTLLMQIREFRFSEITRSMSERGFFFIRADFYQERNGSYNRIDHIDTVLTVKAMDVTKKTLKQGGGFLVALITRELARSTGDGAALSFDEVRNIDSVEKSHMPAYTQPVFADGLYLSYASFRDQVPDRPVTAKEKEESLTDVRTTGPDGRSEKVKRKGVYAVVVSGQPYIATDMDYYPLARNKNNFFFTGQLKSPPAQADILTAQLMFGLLGSLLLMNSSGTFEIRIDHLSGGFVILRQLHIPVAQ